MKFSVQRYNAVPTAADTDAGRDARHDLVLTPQSLKDQLSKPSEAHVCSDGSDSTFSAGDIRALGDPVARRGRLFARRQTRRLVFKDGECNISLGHVAERGRRFLGDIFTTSLDMQWRYVLLLFLMVFVISWLFFALLWWIVCISHGDHLHVDDPNWQPCMGNVHDFVTAFLFSLETQHTIGYGYRVMEPKCPEAVFLLMVQSCLGVFIQSLVTGLVFAKLSRPKRRRNTIMYSDKAVICQRDGEYCLLFRVADMRKSRLVGITARAVLVQNRITKEGEVLALSQQPLEINSENGVDYALFLVWPTTMIHKINENSPFWEMSAEQMLSGYFEIMVFLEGTVESTGMTTQVRTSYLPSELLWGHRLAPLVTYQKENGQYKVDYTQFHTTIPCSMPECSAKQFSEGSCRIDDTETRPSHHMSLGAQKTSGMSPIALGAGLGPRPDHAFTVGPERVGVIDLRKHNRDKEDKVSKHVRSKKNEHKGIISKLNGIIRFSASTENVSTIGIHDKNEEREKTSC